MGDRHVQQHTDMAVVQPVEYNAPCAAGRHGAVRTHEPKGLAYRRFALAAHSGKVMHAYLAGFEQSGEDPDTGRVAHQPEHTGHPLNILHRRQRPLENVNTRQIAVAPDPGRVGNGLKESAHLNILSFDQM